MVISLALSSTEIVFSFSFKCSISRAGINNTRKIVKAYYTSNSQPTIKFTWSSISNDIIHNIIHTQNFTKLSKQHQFFWPILSQPLTLCQTNLLEFVATEELF